MKNKTIERTTGNVFHIERAMRIFDIEESEVTEREYNYAKAQAYAENYGYLGTPKRTYVVHENGVVEFI